MGCSLKGQATRSCSNRTTSSTSDAEALGLRSERAWHGVVGVERHLPAGVVARVEGYYKRFRDLLIGRLETDAEASARAANYDFPSALAWSVPSAPQVTSVPTNSGRGRAYGMDVCVGRHATAPSNRLTGWLSYTWGKAETTAYGRTFPFDYDRQHALGVVANYRVRRSLEMGTTVRVQSGFPYTPARSVRVAGAPDVRDLDGDGNLTEIVPQRDEQGMMVWEADFGDVENLNAGRVPLFARVDVRTTFKPGWSNNRWQFYVEVIDLLNRKNAGSLEPALEYDPASDRPRLKIVREGGLPLIPSSDADDSIHEHRLA